MQDLGRKKRVISGEGCLALFRQQPPVVELIAMVNINVLRCTMCPLFRGK